MQKTLYQEVLHQIQHLNPEDQLQLLEDLVSMVRSKISKKKSILELQGLGKEIWQKVDAQKYVDQERDSWNG